MGGAGMADRERLVPLFPCHLEMKWADLYSKIVAPFVSQQRETIWYGFSLFCKTIEEASLPADIFIGGRFLTGCDAPEEIKFAVAVRRPLGELSIAQTKMLTELARSRDQWLERHHCEFALFFDEGLDGDLTEMIDHWLNSTCINDLGPPIGAIMVKLCQ